MNTEFDNRPIFTSRRKEQEHNRMQAVKMYRKGMSVADIAQIFEVSPRAVFQWVAAFVNYGQSGLVAKATPGRPPKLTADQLSRLAFMVRSNCPNQLSFDFGLWTLRLIRELIEREFKVSLSVPTVGKVMHSLGFSAQRPLHRAWEQDATLVQSWLQTDLPALVQRAQTQGALVLFGDEAGVRSDYHTGTTWAEVGQTPVVRRSAARVSVQMISAIGLNGSMQFMVHEGSGTAEVFLRFLQQLMLDARQPIILVVDGHSIHKAKLVKEYVASTQGKLELVYLPPYSPQLNPDEQVWKNVKAEVAKKPSGNKFEFRLVVEKALLRLQAMTHVVASFFRHPECGFVNLLT
jgi:transposase